MAYSTARMTDDVRNFPPPPQYLVWVGTDKIKHDYSTGQSTVVEAERGRGQIRHLPTLSKCKSYVRPNRRDTFGNDWSIYLWLPDTHQWELQFNGLKGDWVKDNPLFRTRIQGESKPNPLNAEIADAIASITSIHADA